MSETREFKGQLEKIIFPFDISDTFLHRLNHLKSIGLDVGDYDIDEEWLYGDKDIVIVNNVWYRKVDVKDIDGDDIYQAEETEKGYSFHVRYYDGVYSFKEALEEAIKEISNG